MNRILLFTIFASLTLGVVAPAPAIAEDTGHYRLVENWVQFPPEVTKWGSATGVDVDSHDNVYVFHRNDAMPIMAFDRNGKFIRAWGQGMFTTTHFLRTDRNGNVWVTDRGAMTASKFTPDGKLVMTIGKKDQKGDNESKEFYNGMADLVVAKNGDIYIADGEGPNTRVVKLSKDGKFINQWTDLGTPWGVTVKDDLMYLVDGTANGCLLIVRLKDGKVVDRIEGLVNPTAVAVDSKGAIYVGEVNGTNVKKFVKK